MFFEQKTFTAHLLTVLDLEWESQNLSSGMRPYHALSFRSNGNSAFITDDGTVDVKKGEIAFVPAGLVYTHKSGHEKLVVIHFTADRPLPGRILTLKVQDPAYFERKFRELYDAWSKKQLGFSHECKSIFYKIILEMERDFAKREHNLTDDKILSAVEYIHEHFADRDLTVEHLARLCAMSDTYFRRLFVSRFQKTPLRYINDMRFKRARELLRAEYYTVEEIAELCGFNNIHYFSLFIKKETGLKFASMNEKEKTTKKNYVHNLCES